MKCVHVDTRAHYYTLTVGVHGHKSAISFQRRSHYSASPDISAARRTSRLIFNYASFSCHTPASNDSFIITYYCRPEPGSKLCKCSAFWCRKHLCVLLNGCSSGNLIPLAGGLGGGACYRLNNGVHSGVVWLKVEKERPT